MDSKIKNRYNVSSDGGYLIVSCEDVGLREEVVEIISKILQEDKLGSIERRIVSDLVSHLNMGDTVGMSVLGYDKVKLACVVKELELELSFWAKYKERFNKNIISEELLDILGQIVSVLQVLIASKDYHAG